MSCSSVLLTFIVNLKKYMKKNSFPPIVIAVGGIRTPDFRCMIPVF